MKNRRNYYRVLHVQPGAPTAIIRASYHTLMQRLRMHPDLGGDHGRALLINEAFETLSDPARRDAYDRSIARAVARQRTPVQGQDSDAREEDASPSTAESSTCGFCGARLRAVSDRHDDTCVLCGSPLGPAPQRQDGEASRRAVARLSRLMSITFRRAAARQQTWSGTTEDVSLHGMRFRSPVALETGERVRIDCAFCLAVAVVRSIRQDAADPRRRWQCGVEYLTLRIKHDRGGLLSTIA